MAAQRRSTKYIHNRSLIIPASVSLRILSSAFVFSITSRRCEFGRHVFILCSFTARFLQSRSSFLSLSLFSPILFEPFCRRKRSLIKPFFLSLFSEERSRLTESAYINDENIRLSDRNIYVVVAWNFIEPKWRVLLERDIKLFLHFIQQLAPEKIDCNIIIGTLRVAYRQSRFPPFILTLKELVTISF